MATVQQKLRKQSALEMLQAQLKSGVKTKKKTYDEKIPLTDKDKARIEREIKNLKEKL
jgi:flagellin-like hook-associated protein FlgL